MASLVVWFGILVCTSDAEEFIQVGLPLQLRSGL